MTTVFIIHGAYGSPDENWIPWLKGELEKKGCNVITPKFPTPEGQDLGTWLGVMRDYKNEINEDTIFVGHSLAPAFILSIIEMLERPVRAAFFVAPFVSELGKPEFDLVNKTFYRKFDWAEIKERCKKFYVFHSDNDPYVPLEKAEFIAKQLGVEVILVKGAGHFNKDAGYTTFDLLLQKIRGEL